MAVSVFKTWSSGDILTAADLNSSFSQFANGGTDVAFPLTKNASLGGFSLFFDSGNLRSLTDSAKGQNLAATAINDTKTTIASATTPDIWTSTGALIDYTGTATATGFAAAGQAGARRSLLCAGAALFTAGANMLIDGWQSGATMTVAAGDVVDVIAVTTTQFRLKLRKYVDPSIYCDISTCDFRLTLTTAVPVTTADVTGNTLYFTPYKGNRIALFDGTSWNIRTSAEFSIGNGSLSAATTFDVFCYDNAGVPTLEILAWTNDTTRATALVLQNGVLVKSGATTRRYVGTIRSTNASQYQDSNATRWVWNYYNRVRRSMFVNEATASWNYTTNTIRQANANAANQLDFVIGYAEDSVAAEVYVGVSNSTGGVNVTAGIGLDVTNAITTGLGQNLTRTTNAAGAILSFTASVKVYPGIGRHFLSWNELSIATGTTTWYSSNASGIQGDILA